MTLPDKFNPIKHLKTTLKQVHNREVREAFSELGGDDWLPDINTPRASLRTACLIDDKDTTSIILMRIHLLFLHLRRAKDYQAPIIGIPKGKLDQSRVYRPQIHLFFREDSGDVEEGYTPVEGEISFRLMNEDSNSITKAELTTLANKIKLEFGAGNGYLWKKGKDYFSYTDKEKGYQLQILAFSDTEAEQLIKKVLDIQGHTFSASKMGCSTNKSPTEAYPTIPSLHTILGDSQRKPRRRPVATVRFQYALCNLWGAERVVPLYDRTFAYLNALVD
jgi:hypothetical protein